MNILFIGGGNMARALIGGLLKRGFAAQSISVVESDAAARAQLAAEFSVRVEAQIDASIDSIDVVLLAVKPQQMRVAVQAFPALGRQLVISIAAGVRTADLSRWLGGYTHIVRVMPNTPALVLSGISALFAHQSVTAPERQNAEKIVAAVGATLWVDREEKLDAVTAVSGSGPAYVFYFIEALQAAALELGLDQQEARSLSLHTFVGAARLAELSNDDVSVLRARVTSKGGTTERALACLMRDDLKSKFIEAVKQAAERSRELGEQLGSSA